MATPLAAAVAALIWSQNPDGSGDQRHAYDLFPEDSTTWSLRQKQTFLKNRV